MLFIQHYFNGSEFKKFTDDKDDPVIEPMAADDEKVAAAIEDDKTPDALN